MAMKQGEITNRLGFALALEANPPEGFEELRHESPVGVDSQVLPAPGPAWIRRQHMIGREELDHVLDATGIEELPELAPELQAFVGSRGVQPAYSSSISSEYFSAIGF